MTKFKEAEKTKKFETEFFWSVLLGPVVSVSDNESGVIFTSHESLLNAPKTEILYY